MRFLNTTQKLAVLLFSLMVFSFLLMGYQTGVHDQGIYIPILNKLVNPELYSQDPLLTIISDSTTITWVALAPVAKLIGVYATLLIAHIASYCVIIYGAYRTGKILTKSKNWGLMAAIIFTLLKISFAFVTNFGNYFAPRYLAIGILTIAFSFLLEKKYVKAILLTSLAANINMLFIAPFFGFLLLSISWIEWRRWKTTSLYWLLAVVTVLPLFLFRASATGSGISFGVNSEWFEFLQLTFPYFYDLTRNLPTSILNVEVLLGFSYIAIIFILLRKLNLKSTAQKIYITFTAGIILVEVANLVMQRFLPITIFMQLQLVRVGVLLPFLAYTLLILDLKRNWDTYQNKIYIVSQTIFAYLGVSIIGLVLLLNNGTKKLYKIIQVLFPVGLVLLIIPFILIDARAKTYAFNLDFLQQERSDLALQAWMRENTNVDDLFIAPTTLDETYISSPRVFSERSIILANADFGLVALSEGYEQVVFERENDLSGGEFAKWYFDETRNQDFGNMFYVRRSGYKNLTTSEILSLRQKYDADYMITEVDHQLIDFIQVYENSDFRVYKL